MSDPMQMPVRAEMDFCIEVGFERGTESPARVFKATAEWIEAFQAVDKILIQSIDSKIRPVLLLEDIEAASLKTWLRDQIEDADDEALTNLDWKPLVGRYLVKAKYRMVDFLGKRTTVSQRAEIVDLQQTLLKEAQQVSINPIPIHTPVPEGDIVQMLKLLTGPLDALCDGDSAKYVTAHEEATFNIEFNLSPESMDQLITRETITNTAVMILKVKRPDYLGESMWDFRFEGHPLEAKIIDTQWLRRFQDREIEVRPGDAIKADVCVYVRYGYDGEVLGKKYEVLKVSDVIRIEYPRQTNLT